MVTESDISDGLSSMRKRVTKEKNFLYRRGLITSDEKEDFNKMARLILRTSRSRNLYHNLSRVLNYMGFNTLDSVELYDFLVLYAVLKHPGSFLNSDAKTAVKCIEYSYDNWGNTRNITQAFSFLVQMDKRPVMRIKEWKDFSKTTKDVDFSNSEIPFHLLVRMTVNRENYYRECPYDMKYIDFLLRK